MKESSPHPIASISGAHLLRVDPPNQPEAWVVLNWDGTLEHGPDYDPSEAARVFWDALIEVARQMGVGGG